MKAAMEGAQETAPSLWTLNSRSMLVGACGAFGSLAELNGSPDWRPDHEPCRSFSEPADAAGAPNAFVLHAGGDSIATRAIQSSFTGSL